MKKIRASAALLGALGLLSVLVLNLGNSSEASEEWQYTTHVATNIGGPLSLIALAWGSGFFSRLSRFSAAAPLKICGFLTVLLVLVPVISPPAISLSWPGQFGLSICWALAFICGALFLFFLAARLSAFFSLLACLLASIFLGFGACEIWFLAMPRPSDWMVENMLANFQPGQEPQAKNGWHIGQCGQAPAATGQPWTISHSLSRKDLKLYNVVYSFDGNGRRIMPHNRNAENDLLLFGCSFTFGGGLNDAQTWPFQLARLLGPAWQVDNYAQNGYGPAQMLCMLEKRLLAPVQGKQRLAFYLAIENQLFRNDFFENTPHYVLNDKGEPEMSGTQRYVWIRHFPRIFNGSLLAKRIAAFLTGIISANNPGFRRDYLVMLVKSSHLLASEYGAKLYVLLWPDLEDLAPDLRAAAIPYIYIRQMLPDWDKDGGGQYRIHPELEMHPNAHAAELLARGLAAEVLKLSDSRL